MMRLACEDGTDPIGRVRCADVPAMAGDPTAQRTLRTIPTIPGSPDSRFHEFPSELASLNPASLKIHPASLNLESLGYEIRPCQAGKPDLPPPTAAATAS